MTDLNGLRHFKAKLEHLNKALSDDNLAEKVAQRGAEMAENEYSGTSIQVSVEKRRNNSLIVASGEHVAYLEYGTGKVGKALPYPEEKRPQSGVPITGNWEYYYNNPETKVKLKDGREGWYLGSNFMTGRPAGMQMLHTAQNLKREIPRIVKDTLGD